MADRRRPCTVPPHGRRLAEREHEHRGGPMTEPWEALCAPVVEPEPVAVPARPATGRRRPVRLVLGLGGLLLVSFSLVATAFASLDKPWFDCRAYSEQAAERRHLTEAERREVQRSCSVSKI